VEWQFPFGRPQDLCYNRAATESKSGARRTTVETLARRFYVSGIVQGVGFRFFAERVAARLGLGGYVKNLLDGRVEVYAIGSAAQLNSLKIELQRGPRMATVEEITEAEAEVLPAFTSGFTIERDN
jgi:acylphosphatase